MIHANLLDTDVFTATKLAEPGVVELVVFDQFNRLDIMYVKPVRH
jgi:hypothetical protein